MAAKANKISTLELRTALAKNKIRNANLQQQLASQQSKLANLTLAAAPRATTLALAAAPGKNAARNRRRRLRQREGREMFNSQPGMAPPQMRDGTLGNPADPRTGRTMRQLGQTQLGATWCLRALHPCGEGLNLVPKVPDGALSDSVVMERRDEYVLSCPFDKLGAGETWDAVVISVPALRTPTLAMAWHGPVEEKDLYTVARTMIQNSGAAVTPATGQYPAWVSVSGVENVSYTIMPCAALDKGKEAKLGDVFLSLRRTYCGLTTDYDANSLTDKGRVISGQFVGTLADTMGNVAKKITVTGTEGVQADQKVIQDTFDLATYTGVPLTEDGLTQMDLKVRQAEAKSGDYMPIRFWEPVFTNASGADPSCADFVPQDKSVVGSDYDTALANWNYPLKGWGFGMTFWRTMDKTTSLRLKRREGLEMNTSALSDFSPFSTPAYPADLRAQTVFREYCRQQPHSFDSSYNSLGGMLGDIVRGLGGVLGGLGIPIVSDIAPGLGGFLGGLLGQVPI